MTSLSDADLESLAQRLHEARKARQEIPRLTEEFPKLSEAEAYEVQHRGIQLRLDEGERLVGQKMGLTSEAKRQQMDLHSPIYGELTQAMEIHNGGVLSLGEAIHPKVEPEIAFFIAKELSGDPSLDEVKAACTKVAPALEVLDSRFVGFKYFSLPDVIADNSSSYRFVVGPWVTDFSSLDLKAAKMSMSVNDQLAHEATGEAISGDPWISVVQLCQLLAKEDRKLPAGTVVLAGAATTAVMLEPGMKVTLEVEGLGTVNMSAK